MRMSMSICKQTSHLLHIPTSGIDMKDLCRWPQKEKVVVVMGATGTGKSRLSIDLATRFPAEIVNSDKMQVYEGLDIVTNKITKEERCGVPHHLLGVVDPNKDVSATTFCTMASLAVNSIVRRGQLPIIVGGSNSFIEALIDDEEHEFRSKYECCFLWVDVSMPVLNSFVSHRVDRMVERGMINEVRNMFNENADYSRGIRRAIGVPEFHHFFRGESLISDEETRARLLEEAINAIKINTRKLAHRQRKKISRLKKLKGWKIHQLDATNALRKRGRESDEAWENLVAGPSTEIVSQFLYNFHPLVYSNLMGMRAVKAAATHT